MLERISAAELLTALTAVAFIVGAIAVGWATWRLRMEGSWKQSYERQKSNCVDLTTENQRLKSDLKDAERESERFRQRYFKTLADAERYEKKYGELPPD